MRFSFKSSLQFVQQIRVLRIWFSSAVLWLHYLQHSPFSASHSRGLSVLRSFVLTYFEALTTPHAYFRDAIIVLMSISKSASSATFTISLLAAKSTYWNWSKSGGYSTPHVRTSFSWLWEMGVCVRGDLTDGRAEIDGWNLGEIWSSAPWPNEIKQRMITRWWI